MEIHFTGEETCPIPIMKPMSAEETEFHLPDSYETMLSNLLPQNNPEDEIAMKEKERPALTQRDKILDYLESNGSITPLEALNLFGCFRLAARICELKHEGIEIKSYPYKTPGGATIAKYSLKSDITQTELL